MSDEPIDVARGIPITAWCDAKLRYITSTLSYEKTALEFGIPYHLLRNQAVAEGWHHSRAYFQAEMADQAVVDIQAFLNKVGKQYLTRIFIHQGKLFDEIERSLLDFTEAKGDKPRDKHDVDELRRIVETGVPVIKGLRESLGISEEISKEVARRVKPVLLLDQEELNALPENERIIKLIEAYRA